MNLEIDFGDAPQPALAPRSMTSSQLQVSDIVQGFCGEVSQFTIDSAHSRFQFSCVLFKELVTNRAEEH